MMLRQFLKDLRSCRGEPCRQGGAPCTEQCLDHPDCRGQAPAANDPNLGTLDPRLCSLLRDALRIGAVAGEPEYFQAGYVSGHRHGWLNGTIVGLVAGAVLVAGGLKLGLLAGGWL